MIAVKLYKEKLNLWDTSSYWIAFFTELRFESRNPRVESKSLIIHLKILGLTSKKLKFFLFLEII